MSNIGIVILAAGSSSRMGRNKLSLKIGHETLLEKVVNAACCSVADKVVVVLGANSEENRSLIEQQPTHIAINNRWKSGIGSSIKCGLQKAQTENPNLQALIISVCDQPYLSAELFNRLIEKYHQTGKQIIASAYDNAIGIPVLYDKSVFEELLELPDKHGAKKHILLKANKDKLSSVPFPKGAVDIDTMADLETFIRA